MAYEIEVRHEGLHKYRVIRGSDSNVVGRKAQAQVEQWDAMWDRKQASEAKRFGRELKAKNKEEKQRIAAERTQEALDEINRLENVLAHTLDIDDTIEWESLKDFAEFMEPKPNVPLKQKYPSQPQRSAPAYNPKLGLLDYIFPSRKRNRLQEAENLFKEDQRQWRRTKDQADKEHELKQEQYDEQLEKWEADKVKFLKKQKDTNQSVEREKAKYFEKQSDAILDYCYLVLSDSDYPDYFPQHFQLDYNSETRMVVVDYSLPNLAALPRLKEAKYIQSRNEFEETLLSDSVVNTLYDKTLYQVALRSIHELYEADVVKALDSIVFNGWVKSIDRGTGKEVNACVLTVQAGREEFLAIDLVHVDPKLCFKTLKGVAASRLHSLAPVAPIVKIEMKEERFVS